MLGEGCKLPGHQQEAEEYGQPRTQWAARRTLTCGLSRSGPAEGHLALSLPGTRLTGESALSDFEQLQLQSPYIWLLFRRVGRSPGSVPWPEGQGDAGLTRWGLTLGTTGEERGLRKSRLSVLSPGLRSWPRAGRGDLPHPLRPQFPPSVGAFRGVRKSIPAHLLTQPGSVDGSAVEPCRTTIGGCRI